MHEKNHSNFKLIILDHFATLPTIRRTLDELLSIQIIRRTDFSIESLETFDTFAFRTRRIIQIKGGKKISN